MAGSSQSFLLSWPPGVNQLYRCFRGRSIISSQGRKWYAAARLELMGQKVVPVLGPIELDIYLCAPTKRRYDPDGKVKALLDLLVQNAIIEDDNDGIMRRLLVIPVEANAQTFTGARLTLREATP